MLHLFGSRAGRKVASFVFVTILGSATSCDRKGEEARQELTQRRAGWTHEIAAMRSHQAELAVRFDQQAAANRIGDPATARTRAVLEGARQSIGDLEGHLRQLDVVLEPAFRKGGEEAEHALERASGGARASLEALAAQLVVANRAVAQLPHDEERNGEPTTSRQGQGE